MEEQDNWKHKKLNLADREEGNGTDSIQHFMVYFQMKPSQMTIASMTSPADLCKKKEEPNERFETDLKLYQVTLICTDDLCLYGAPWHRLNSNWCENLPYQNMTTCRDLYLSDSPWVLVGEYDNLSCFVHEGLKFVENVPCGG